MIYFSLKAFLRYANGLNREKALNKGEKLGRFVWRTGLRKKVILKNLEIAFPERDLVWRNEIGKKFYEHIGRVVMEFGRLPNYFCTKEIGTLVVVKEGGELLEKYRNTGAVLISGHLGNWEMMGTSLASKGFKISALAYKQKNKRVNDLLHQIRTACCINIVYHRDSIKPLVRALNNREFAVFLADQNTVKERGVFVDFFGKSALTVDFPAKLAVRFNKPVLFCFTGFDENERIYKMFVREFVWDRGNSKRENIHNLVQAYTIMIEQAVKKYPYQFLWGHKRWKTRPEGELPIY